MAPSATTRVRGAVTILVTLVIVLGEFAFLMSVYHLDDQVEGQLVAQARVTGALETWQPGADTAAVEEAVRSLATTAPAGVRRLETLTRSWAAAPDATGLRRVRAADDAVGASLSAAQHGVGVRAALILAALLVLVSIGWAFWFRKLVRRHRELQRALTEQQTLDSGERRLLALVQNSVDVLAVLEPDSTATFLSPSTATVLGLAPADLVGRRFVDLLVPRDVPMFVRMLAGDREGEQPVTLRLTHADGRELVLEGTLNNLLADALVSSWVLTVRDVTDRHALQEELQLPGVPRPADRAAQPAAVRRPARPRAARTGTGPPSRSRCCFLDLDDFKHVNDTLGHGIGDQLLVTVAERIAARIRQGDTAARLGGDEFARPDGGAERPRHGEVAERLLAALRDPVSVDGHPALGAAASIGVAPAMPAETTARSCCATPTWRCTGPRTAARAGSRSTRPACTPRPSSGWRCAASCSGRSAGPAGAALPADVDLRPERIAGFEALVRWNHPTRGLLPPSSSSRSPSRAG